MSAQLPSPANSGDGGLASSRDRDGEGIPVPGSDHSGPPDAPGHTSNGLPQAPSRRSAARLSRTSTTQNAKEKEANKGLSKTQSTAPPSGVGLDPLSTQIYLRTSNTEPSIAQRLRNPTRPESPTTDAVHDIPTKSSNGPVDANRERKKGPSFLSRLGMRGARKKDDDMPDADSELGDLRTDGSNARAMTSIVGAGGGYIPLYKEPPRYIRVKPHNKKGRDFNRLFLAQELLGTKPPAEDESQRRTPATAVGNKILKAGDAIWAAEFSVDGQYLAVAGKDQTVRVFSVISTPEERHAHEEEENQKDGNGERLSAPVFRSKPTREFEGHTGEVLALSWSKNNFLLSSSMDKTVKLWHMSRKESLCSFKHNDLVTSIAFHPTDDRFFLAGSLDAQLRLWSIPDKAVAFSAMANEFITAVAFSPDGKSAICGVLSGLCLFYETEGLKFQFQIHVRSSRGKNAKGSKITGIRTAQVPSDAGNGDVKVLISSNDSRVRIYSLKTRMLEVKFRGLENQSSQIHARFSDDGMYVISGSEDRRAYIWGASHPEAELKDKQPYEAFDAHPEVVTTALMAPVKSRQLLSASGDPIYDLCNPPPVMLLSLDEKTPSQIRLWDGGHPEAAPGPKKPEESPAYIERSKHLDGNIIVTTDRTGTIKVFRQDCAFAKRQQNTWETGSKFSGKLAGVGRSASIITKTSGGSRVHSRRGSLNLGPAPVQVQPPSDRIMSWRQDIEGRASTSGTTARSERSMSPMKANRSPLNTSAANLASEARRQPYASSPVLRPNNPASPTSSVQTSRASLRLPKDKDQGPGPPPTPSFSLVSVSDPEHHEDKGEAGFWNLSRWKGGLPAIPGLRYSTNASSSGAMTNPGVPVAHSRAESDSLAPGVKATPRRSLGINELHRLAFRDDGGRRRSMGPTLTARPGLSESDSMAGSVEEGLERAETPSANKRRTDSGVAQLSADSTDESDGATCRECGGHSFKNKRAGKDRTVRVCEKCGTKPGR
ncbi:putative WD repeat-containing protein C3H5.08c [Tolypocladium ophioglossoides CBS 100239]|uniref:Putative WD repeat-containing protein C3H5.08c n=1 Tax=Tolypocladium ophioglossoides (strain CBS 100239) TaxID=1163406 RepID=A0A0L0N9J4_TOLOC|nr:putative WD repeat-containing protein C3H5.08c [Tolypocladium ophioglossoides CBS 100239]